MPVARCFGRSSRHPIRLDRAAPITSAPVFIAKRCLSGNGNSRSCFFEPVACSSASLRISASSAFSPKAGAAHGLALQSLVIRGCNDLLAAARRRQGALRH